MDEETDLPEIDEGAILESRSATVSSRADAGNRKTLYVNDRPPLTSPLITTKYKTTNRDDLYSLQSLVLTNVPNRVDEGLLRRIFRSKELTPAIYATIYLGLKKHLLEPNMVLLEALPVATSSEDVEYQEGNDKYLSVVALALRFGADPNQYVDVGALEKYHILYYVHRLNDDKKTNLYDVSDPDERYVGLEEISRDEVIKNRVIELLILSGADPSMPLIDIDKNTRETLSYVDLYLKSPDSKRSVLYNIEADFKSPPEVLLNDERLLSYAEERTIRINDLVRYRNRPEDLTYNLELWSLETILDNGYLLDNPRPSLVIVQDADTPQELQYPIILHGPETFKELLDRLPEGTPLIDYLIKSNIELNTTSTELLLKKGAIPDYRLVDETLIRAKSIKDKEPLTLALYGELLFLYTKYGYGLDDAQLISLGVFDPITYTRLKNYIVKTPYWQRVCLVPTNEATEQLREAARDVGIDPNISKARICEALQVIGSRPQKDVIAVAKSRQENRLNALTTTLDELLLEPTNVRSTRSSTSSTTNNNNTTTTTTNVRGTGSRTTRGASTCGIMTKRKLTSTSSLGTRSIGNNPTTSRPDITRQSRGSIYTNTDVPASSKYPLPPASRLLEPNSETSTTTTIARGGTTNTTTTTNNNKPIKFNKRVCSNESTLPNDPTEYGDLDIVSYEDDNKKTWCFLSQDYKSVIDAGINPHTEKPLPRKVKDELISKYNQIRASGTPIKGVPISKGVSRINKGGVKAENLKSEQSLQQLKNYYTLYGIDPRTLTEDYTTQDMQVLLDTIYGDTGVTIDRVNRTHALYTFSNFIVTDIMASPDEVARTNEIFDIIIASSQQ